MTNTTSSRSLPPGIYCPSVSFFRDTPEQELDLETYTRHVEVLVRSGIKGIVVLGSTAEAVALTSEESSQVRYISRSRFAGCEVDPASTTLDCKLILSKCSSSGRPKRPSPPESSSLVQQLLSQPGRQSSDPWLLSGLVQTLYWSYLPATTRVQ